LSGGREDLAVFDGEDICRSAFGSFAALVEHKDFVESFLTASATAQTLLSQEMLFTPARGEAAWRPVFAEGEAPRFRDARGGRRL